jgi:hypothetical protein
MGKHPGGRPPIFKSVEELQEKIDAYKEYLETSGKPPTIAGLAYYTGIDRQTLYNYKEKDEFFGTIKKFVNWILSTYEEQAVEKGNAGIIFLMKNYGYTDKQQVETTGEVTLRVKTPEEIEEEEY